ncbi:hypothetical protein Tco_1404114, partial [Tanacetum coccineum]
MGSICIAQLHIMITEMEAMPDRLKVYDSLLCLKESKAAKNNKLAGLNDLVAQTEEVISMKEGHVKVMEEAISWLVYGNSLDVNNYECYCDNHDLS